MRNRLPLHPSLILAAGLAGVVAACGKPSPPEVVAIEEVATHVSKERTVRFPEGKPLGQLWVRTWGEDSELQTWKLLGVAKGEVTVPAGKELRLVIDSEGGWADLTPLAKLGPFDLQALKLSGENIVRDRDLRPLRALPGLTALNLNNQPSIDDGGLRAIQGLGPMRLLGLKGTKVTDGGLAALERLPHLDFLDLGFTSVTDAGLAHIEGLTTLKQIFLPFSRVKDAGLARLKGMKELHVLVLSNTDVGDAGLESIKGLNQMEWLYLHNTRVTDAGLVHLKGMPRLRALILDGCRVTDEGLKALVGLPKIEMLSLVNTETTDAALPTLLSLPALNRLSTGGTRITDEAIERLRRERPELVVNDKPPLRPPAEAAPEAATSFPSTPG